MVKTVSKDIVKGSVQKTRTKLLFINRSEHISCYHLTLKLHFETSEGGMYKHNNFLLYLG